MCIGLVSGYNPPKPRENAEKVSLLKPYTNFDKIKDMKLNELAEKLAIVEVNAACVYCEPNQIDYITVKEKRKKQWLEYLESEAER